MSNTSYTIVSKMIWTNQQRNQLINFLGELMSECSEECWSASWLEKAEKEIPILVEQVLHSKEPVKWGHCSIDYETAISLKGLANMIGSWVMYDEDSDGYTLIKGSSS